MRPKKVLHYIIGDIHGCFVELQALEVKIRKHATKHGALPFIIAVGDLVDRGPDSAKVVEHFRQGELAGTHACIMGNHEQEMLKVLASWAPKNFTRARCQLPPYIISIEKRHKSKTSYAKYLSLKDFRTFVKLNWVGQGGSRTIASFGGDPERPETWRIDAKTLRYLVNLPLVWHDTRVVVTHALATPESLKAALAFDDRRIFRGKEALLATVTWNREKPRQPADPKRLHVSGHSIFPKVKRHRKARAMQIDTGCVAGGKLTAYCVETTTLVSVGLTLVRKT